MSVIKVSSSDYEIGGKEDKLISYGFVRCSPVVLRADGIAGLLHWNSIEEYKSMFKLIYMTRDLTDVTEGNFEAIIANKSNQLDKVKEIITGIDSIVEPEFMMGNMVFEFSKKPRIKIVKEYTSKNFDFPSIYKAIYTVKDKEFRIEDCGMDNF